MATELQQSLLDSIQMLSQNSVDNSNSPATIKATIVDVIDSATYRYLIKYGDNSRIEAISSSSASYQVGDTVYVLVPDGDLSKTNVILGAAVPYAALYATSEEASNTYIEITDSLFGEISGVNLKSWENHSPTEAGSQIAIDTTNFGLVFKDYLENYKNFIFTAKVKTEIDKYHQVQGNYGLVLKLPFYVAAADGSKTQTWKICQMDVDSMLGNPYNYEKEQLINLYYDIPDGWTYDTTRNPELASFVGGFGYTAPRADIEYDIHFNSIGIKIADALTDADKTGYHLSLVASSGNYFLTDTYDETKILTPKLKVNGKDTSVSSWDCYWFIEDTSIKTDSDDYLSLGGLGWKCINEKTNVGTDDTGKPIYQYITSNHTCTISAGDVVSTLRYKCILTKDNAVVTGTILIKNLNSKIDLDLRTPAGSNSFVENIGNVNIIARIYYPTVTDQDSDIIISYSWQRFDKDGNYLDDDFYDIVRYNDKIQQAITPLYSRGVFETEITYPCYLLDQSNLIKCTFYSSTTKNGTIVKNILGTETILVTTESQYDYKLSLYNGDVIYKYDADGDSPLVANYDGPVSSRIDTIKPIEFKVFKADGTELNETEYRSCNYTWRIPKNSMISLATGITPTSSDDDYYYVSGTGQSSLNYKIANVFNKRNNNNDVSLTIDFAGSTLSSVASIKFLKDGESGTNGTRYSAVITYRENSGEQDFAYGEKDANGKIRKLQFVYVNDERRWYRYGITHETYSGIGSPQLLLNVYADGENITSQTSRYSCKWEMFDSAAQDKTTSNKTCFAIDSKTGVITSIGTVWSDSSVLYTNVARATITIKKTASDKDSDHQNVIYAYYPIEITWMASKTIGKYTRAVPSLAGGFDEVLYNAGGTDPEYDSSTPFSCVSNLATDTTGYYQYNWSGSNNLKVSSSTTYQNKIAPVNKFDNGCSNNYVRVDLSMSDANIAALQGDKTAAEEGASTAQKYIEFYTRNKTNILAFVQEFNYDTYISRFKASSNLLKYRGEMIQFIEETLTDSINELEKYCVNNNVNVLDFNYTYYCDTRLRILNEEKDKLYLLLGINSLSDISNLSNTLFGDMSVQIEAIRTRNGSVVANTIAQMISNWDMQINSKYKNLYNTIIVLPVNEINNLHDTCDDLKFLLVSPQLIALTEAYQDIDPLQEFLNLKEQLTVLIGGIDDSTKDYDNYYNIDSLLLMNMQKLLEIYKNTDYQNDYYAKVIAEYTAQKENYEDAILSYGKSLMPDSTSFIVHIKPIIMLFNTYELSYLNGWDGNKLYTDETNGQYIIAPQVGAGSKSNDGKFTGITMGVRKFSSENQHIGIFGYSSGVQSMFLNAKDGSAIFGKSGIGQVTIDPSQNKALIYSGNYFKNYGNDGKPTSYSSGNLSGAGMMIDLTTPEIKFGNGNFSVNSSGHLVAKGGGSIAGWSIGNKTLSAAGITINSEGSITGDGLNGGSWSINRGHATFNSATITGKITTGELTATGGKIGGWTIDGTSLSAKGITISSSGSISGDGAGGATWSINRGSATFNNATITGTITTGNLTATGGKIGGWNINSTSLSNNGITISSDGTISGDGAGGGSWSISRGNATFNNATISGTIATNNLTATGGSIGGCEIGPSYIGVANGWVISSTGEAVFNNITANGGTIAGWTISGTSINNGTIDINSGGWISGPGFTLSSTGVAVSNPNSTSSLNWGDNFSVNTSGILTARGANFGGTVTATGATFRSNNGGSFSLEGSNNHPTVSGLNVSDAGINLNGHSISSVYELSNGTNQFINFANNGTTNIKGSQLNLTAINGISITSGNQKTVFSGGIKVDGIQAGDSDGHSSTVNVRLADGTSARLKFVYGIYCGTT